MKKYQLVFIKIIFYCLVGCSHSGAGHVVPKSEDTTPDGVLNLDLLLQDHKGMALGIDQKVYSGLAADIDYSPEGKGFLMSTTGDPDRKGPSAGKRELQAWDQELKMLWRFSLPYAVKGISFYNPNLVSVVALYNARAIGVSPKGVKLWEREANCLPFVLKNPEIIVCFHNDDVKADTAFEIWDHFGKTLAVVKTQVDVVVSKWSRDRKFLALGFQDGKIALYDFATLLVSAPKIVPILSLGLQNGFHISDLSLCENQKWAVLSHRDGVSLAEIYEGKKSKGHTEVPVKMTQIELGCADSKEEWVWMAGIWRSEQFLGYWNNTQNQKKWMRSPIGFEFAVSLEVDALGKAWFVGNPPKVSTGAGQGREMELWEFGSDGNAKSLTAFLLEGPAYLQGLKSYLKKDGQTAVMIHADNSTVYRFNN